MTFCHYHSISIKPYSRYHRACFSYDFTPSAVELKSLSDDFGGVFKIPSNFVCTAPPHLDRRKTTAPGAPPAPAPPQGPPPAPQICINPQTTLMCDMLSLTDPFAVFSGGRPAHHGGDGGAANFDPAQNVDESDSLDVDDRDEGILDDSDFVNDTMDASAGTSPLRSNPDADLHRWPGGRGRGGGQGGGVRGSSPVLGCPTREGGYCYDGRAGRVDSSSERVSGESNGNMDAGVCDSSSSTQQEGRTLDEGERGRILRGDGWGGGRRGGRPDESDPPYVERGGTLPLYGGVGRGWREWD